jgi:hypothetical protein
MNAKVFRYQFHADVPIAEVEASLVLAIFAAESLHGEPQVRLDAGHALDPERRICVIDGSTDVGRDLNRIFLGYLQREFGPDSFSVERIVTNNSAQSQEVS